MLMGEHAVLRNHLALCAAIDHRLTVALHPNHERVCVIDSTLQKGAFAFEDLPTTGPLRFVAQCIHERFDSSNEGGLNVSIRSELPTTVGLGSSAAVVVALMHGLALAQGRTEDLQSLQQASLKVIQAVQGRGSGADVAASVAGGCVAYRIKPFAMRRYASVPPLAVFYSGAKRPTVEVVAEVDARAALEPDHYEALFAEMDALSVTAESALDREDWTQLGQLMTQGQQRMEAIGVSNDRLRDMLDVLGRADGVFGAKISGSGLGDCVVALGQMSDDVLREDRVSVQLSPNGVSGEVLCA